MRAILISAVMVLASFGFALGQGIYVDHVDGLDDPVLGTFPPGATLTFYMRVVGDGTNHLMLNNGYTFASNHCTWGAITGAFTTEFPVESWFDFIRVVNLWADGVSEDTVGTGLLSLFGTGLPVNFDGVLYTITIGPIDGMGGDLLVFDSSWYPPSNPWMWDVVGEDVAWGGPYIYKVSGEQPPATYCTPQPTILKDITDILEVHIINEYPAEIQWATVLIQGKIPPSDGYPQIQDGHLVTGCSVKRFLGSSGFRPITGDFEATYIVTYTKTDGTEMVLTGDYALKVYPGDVTFDGKADISDVTLMADYFWREGGVAQYLGDDFAEFMDVDQNGTTDPMDVIATIRAAGF